MTIAALLAKEGYSVTVLERNPFVGGKAASYERDGFTVDYGTHTCPSSSKGPLGEVARITGAKLEFIEPKHVVSLMASKRTFHMYATDSDLVSFIKIVRLAGIKARNLVGTARALFRTMNVKSEGDIVEYDGISMEDYLLRYTRDEGFHGFIDLYNALMFAISSKQASAGEYMLALSTMIKANGLGYPKGGAYSRIPRSYLESCEERGGQVLLSTEATAIRVESGKATGVEAGGTFYPADVVVCNGGIRKAVELAGRENFPGDYVQRMETLKDSDAAVTLKLALDQKPFDAPVMFYLPDGLDLARDMEDMARGEVPEDLQMFMPSPTNFDPECAPEGKHLLLACTMVPSEMPLGTDEKILDRVEERVFALFPGLEEHLLWKHRTNLDLIKMLGGRDNGNVIGLAQTCDQVGKNKPDARTPVEGLFMVGCDAGGRGIGMEQAADSALKVAEMITSRTIQQEWCMPPRMAPP